MPIYAIYAGSCNSPIVYAIDCYENQLDANHAAYNHGREDYQSYEGHYGLPCFGDIEANPEDFGLEENPSENEIFEALEEEMSDWIEAYAVELTTLQELRELCEKEDYEIALYLVGRMAQKRLA